MNTRIGLSLAELTKREMELRGWSFRQAQRETGASFGAVERMTKGVPVETDTIIRFAYSVAQPENRADTVMTYLEAAGKTELVDVIRSITSTANLRIETSSVAESKERYPQVDDIATMFSQTDAVHQEIALLVLQHGATQYTRPSNRQSDSTVAA